MPQPMRRRHHRSQLGADLSEFASMKHKPDKGCKRTKQPEQQYY